MKTAIPYFVACMVFLISGCGGSSNDSASSITVKGTVSGISASIAHAETAKSSILSLEKATYDSTPNCPTTDQSNSMTATPSAYNVAFKRVTLLGSSTTGTSDFDLINVDTIEEATEVDFVTNSTFSTSSTIPPAGTYDGIEIEVYYIGETIPMVVPYKNALDGTSNFTVANYNTRGYFSTVESIQPRDVSIFWDDASGVEGEYWINRDNYDAVAVTGTHPDRVLDLWSDPNFWCEDGLQVDGQPCTLGWRTPMTICTRSTSTCDATLFGTDFTFAMTDGSSSLAIPASGTGTYEITFAFDVDNKFTFWGDTNNPSPTTEAFGTFRVGYDCGYRIMFPNVTISMTSE